jgi:FkbM family methyltransferase
VIKNYPRNGTVAEKKAFWLENPLVGDITIQLDFAPNFLMRCENDDTVVKELYWTGFKGWENTSLMLWSRLMADVSHGLILDIGSYSGIYSLLAGKQAPHTQILAFDIQQRCVDRLKENSKINKITNIDAFHCACSAKNGEVDFYFYEEAGILSSVASLMPSKINDRKATVPAIIADDFLNKKYPDTPVRLIKIDAENAERVVLNGLQNTLAKYAPDVLLEINDDRELANIKGLLPRGYRLFSIDEQQSRFRKVGFFFKGFQGNRNYFASRGRPPILSG